MAASRYHKNLVVPVLNVLREVFWEDAYADKAIERVLKQNRQWGARDRKFIAGTVYDVVRYWRLLWGVAGVEPDPAAFWKLFAAYAVWAGKALPAWDEFAGIDLAGCSSRLQSLQSIAAMRESVPDWLYAAGLDELGGSWEPLLVALNAPAPLVLRANTLLTTREAVLSALLASGIGAAEDTLSPDGIVISERVNIFSHILFREGKIEVQDSSSQLVAPFLHPVPGMRIVDACAGGGGKTLHLAALMQNKGKIIALDTEAWKLQELKKRAARNQVQIVETRPIENLKTIKRLYGSADRLLLDVPCSGLGVLRRNPDTKWKLTPGKIDALKARQLDILKAYAPIVKPGGLLVYATCSILPSENRGRVDAFLDAVPGKYTLEEERSITPGEENADGFYMARIRRLA